MNLMDSPAASRIFVKVSGFTDAERHALNTVFRLSAGRTTAYALWTPLAHDPPARVALIDGDSWEASLLLANPANDNLHLLWVGDNPPPRTALVLQRPLQWTAVLDGLDKLFAADRLPLAQADASNEGVDTGPDPGMDTLQEADVPARPYGPIEFSPTPPVKAVGFPAAPDPQAPHVLVVDADPGARLQLRLKLATAGLLQVDEAASAAEALQWVKARLYALVFLDLELPDTDGWALVHQVAASRPAIRVLVLTGHNLSLLDRVRGRFAGVRGCLPKPLDAEKLRLMLRMVR